VIPVWRQLHPRLYNCRLRLYHVVIYLSFYTAVHLDWCICAVHLLSMLCLWTINSLSVYIFCICPNISVQFQCVCPPVLTHPTIFVSYVAVYKMYCCPCVLKYLFTLSAADCSIGCHLTLFMCDSPFALLKSVSNNACCRFNCNWLVGFEVKISEPEKQIPVFTIFFFVYVFMDYTQDRSPSNCCPVT